MDFGQALFSEVKAVLGWVDDGESSSGAIGAVLSNPCAVLRDFKELLTLGGIRGDNVTVTGSMLAPITASSQGVHEYSSWWLETAGANKCSYK
jgi:hypothetical protein